VITRIGNAKDKRCFVYLVTAASLSPSSVHSSPTLEQSLAPRTLDLPLLSY